MEVEDQKFMRSARLLRSFWSVQKNAMQFIQKKAAENGITVPQYTILMIIVPHKEMTQKTLGEVTSMPKSTLSQSIDGLVQAGYLMRQQVEGNRREIQLILTDRGESFFKKIHLHEGGIHQVFQEAIESLTEEQYQNVLDAHHKISSHLETQLLEQERETKDD